MKRVPFLLLIAAIYLCHACNDEGACTEEDLVSRVNAGFYVRDSLEERDTTLNYVTFYGLLRPDSIIYDAALGIRRIKFPLPHEPNEQSIFIFQVDTEIDTIRIWHQPKLVLVSYACGFTTTHDIFWLSYGSNIIDTISVKNSIVNLTDEQNLRIYIKPFVVADTAQ
ncbi:DUF6452 family protein [Bacteroidota bacterium]